jgi:hypothetical protein
MATNIEIIKKACEGSAYWRVEGIPSLTQILDEARADEREKIVKHLNALIKERNPKDRYGRQLMELIIEEIEEVD